MACTSGFNVFVVLVCVNCLVAFKGTDTRAESAKPLDFEYAGEWGSEGSGEGEFNYPEEIAVAPDGTVYVADAQSDRVQYFSPTGTFLGLWDGTPPGSLGYPKDCAVAANGVVYVTDGNGSRVQYFSPAGEYLGEWGREGSGKGEFDDLGSIVIGPEGRVYVSDHGNGRIQYFDSGGEYLGEWRPGGAADAEGNGFGPVAAGPDGNVYVAVGSCIKIFSSEGADLNEWTYNRDGAAEFESRCDGLAISEDGKVYILDCPNKRILYFSAAGSFLGSWKPTVLRPRRYDSDVPYPSDVVITPNGTVVVIGNWPLEVQFYSPRGDFLRGWPARLRDQQVYSYPVAVGPNGYVYVVDEFADTVHYYNRDGEHLGSWGSRAGMFSAARDIAVGPGGEVYLIPESGHGIMYFSPTGSYIGGWEPEDSFQGWGPVSITPEGNILIGDADEQNWKYFTPSGSLLSTWEFETEINGEAHACRGKTAVGPDGTIYVLESHDNRVCYFDAGGNYLGWWGSKGTGAGEFEYPVGIAVGRDGTVYVLDGCIDPAFLRVQFFSPRGESRGEIRHLRRGDSRFFRGIAVAPDNTLYFTDAANDCVVYFRPVEAGN